MAGKGKKSKKEQKVSKGREEVRAANKPEYVTGTGQKLWRVHLKQDCAHRICDIHNPPQGLPESDWPTHWRADRGLMERICPHGIGHPTKAHMEFLKEMDTVRGTDNVRWEGIHGCDGCCFVPPLEDEDDEQDTEPPNTERDWCFNCGDCHDCAWCDPEFYGVDEDEEPFSLDPEFEPYFDDTPLLPHNGASDWERGVSWDGLLASLFDRKPIPVKDNSDLLGYFFSPNELAPGAHMCPPGHCPEPEWIDHDAPPNGIAPVCKYCHLLIDSDPLDHALDCSRFGNSDGLG